MKLARFFALAAVLALVLPLVGATPGPLYFQRQYRWSGTTVGGVATDTFVVPPTSETICYARLTMWDGSDHVAAFDLTMTDGAGDVAVVDGGGVAHLQQPGVTKVVVPAQPVLWFTTFTPGAFTVRFQAEGFHGNWIIQVYEVDSPAECGTLPP